MGRGTLETYEHLTGCPVALYPERAGQVECYLLDRPANQGGGKVRVTRCATCGEARYEDAVESEEGA